MVYQTYLSSVGEGWSLFIVSTENFCLVANLTSVSASVRVLKRERMVNSWSVRITLPYIRKLSHTYIHTYIHIHAHTHIHTYIHTYIHIHAHTHIHTHIYAHTHIHTYIHTYIHIHAHTHIHTYTHTCFISCELYSICKHINISLSF